MSTRLAGPTLVASLLLARAVTAGDPADEAAVRAHFEAFTEAWVKGDAKAVAAGYAEDADLVRPGEPKVEGRAAIETFYARVFAGPLKGVAKKMTVDHVRLVTPDVAVVDSSYTLDRAAPVLRARGLSVTILVKRGASWTTVSSRSYRLPGPQGR
jgi:uncharacterized protein (TIGR02246 family)